MKDFKEQDQYRLFTDQYNYILLIVSYIESTTVWLSNSDSCYKYDRKTERLYKWCGDGYDRIDTEYGFSKLTSEDVWEQRKQQNSVDYSGFYGD
jgi:hypothetical protein